MARLPIGGLVCASLIFNLMPIKAEVSGYLKIAAIRVSFQKDNSPGTSGDGSFLMEQVTTSCGAYTIDPPPHNNDYFRSQLKAVDHYFRSVSYEKFGLDLDRSAIFPTADNSVYTLDQGMRYYHPLGQEEEYERLSTELFRDAITRAVHEDNLDLSNYDLVVVFHAGVGQDFSFPFLDPTPEDIPSTFVDEQMINYHLGGPILVGNAVIKQGVILPESQNNLLYDESLFSNLDSPCDVQYGLTGTFALMIGFSVGLPPLWDTESGQAGIGIFGLMDQGSNNGRGLVPAPPDLWTRIYAGWDQPTVVQNEGNINLPAREKDAAIKIPINNHEYFLVENRLNWFRDGVSVDSARYAFWEKTNTYPPFVEVLLDSTGIIRDSNGVVVSLSNYDLGLPASGLLIWHIDELPIGSGLGNYSINADRNHRGVDLEEADGAQDMGFISNLIPDPSSGYFGDMWFKGNREYERANPEMKGKSPVFSPYTYPDTKSNSGASSYITIENIGTPGEKINFSINRNSEFDIVQDTTMYIRLSFDFDHDGIEELIGGKDSLWWSNDLSSGRHYLPYEVKGSVIQTITNYEGEEPRLVIGDIAEDSTTFAAFIFKDKQFLKLWIKKIQGIIDDQDYFIGFPDKKNVQLFESDLNIDPEGVVSSLSTFVDSNRIVYLPATSISDFTIDSVTLLDGNLVVGEEGIQNSYYEINFSSIGSVDLDLDGFPDIFGVGDDKIIDSYSLVPTRTAGFPVNIKTISKIVARDLFETPHPELVLQKENGDIVILSWKGNIIYTLANSLSNPLIGLGTYNNKNSIFTQSTIWSFDTTTDPGGNEWSYPNKNPANSRIFRAIHEKIISGTELMVLKRTYAYPNPSHGEPVRIRVQVESAERVDVTIYDIAGYQVDSMTLTDLQKGLANEISWDISNVEPGIYFARVVVSKGNQTEEKVIKIGVIK